MNAAIAAEIGLVVLEIVDAVRAGQMEEEEALAMLREQRATIQARVARTSERVKQIGQQRRML